MSSCELSHRDADSAGARDGETPRPTSLSGLDAMKGQSLRCPGGCSSEPRQQATDVELLHVTAIITPCVPPKVVGEVTSSVTATGVPEVYGLPKTGRNHVGSGQELPAYQEDWLEGGDPGAPGW